MSHARLELLRCAGCLERVPRERLGYVNTRAGARKSRRWVRRCDGCRARILNEDRYAIVDQSQTYTHLEPS